MNIKIEQYKEKLLNIWHALKPREQLLIGSTFIVISLLMILQLGIIYPIKKIHNSEKKINKLQKDLMDLNGLYKEYKKYKNTKRTQPRTLNNQSLLAALEKVAIDNNVKPNVRYMRPASIPVEGKMIKRSVEVKIEAVTIQNLLKTMYDIEHSNTNANIEYYLLRDAYNKPGYYDLIFRVIRLEKRT